MNSNIEEDNNKQQIGYKPNIKYDKDYYANYNNKETETYTVEEEDKNIIDDLLNDLTKLENLINGMPSNIKDAIKEVFDVVKDSFNNDLNDKYFDGYIPNDDFYYKDKDNNEEDNNSSDNDKDDTIDEDAIWDTDDDKDIVTEEVDELDKIDKEYIKNLSDVIDYYINRLETILSHYYLILLTSTHLKSKDDVSFILNNIKLFSSNIGDNYKHLFDLGLKTEIVYDVKLDFYNNIFSMEQTLYHFKSFKIMYEFRKRYASEKYSEENNNTSSMNNSMLSACNVIYNKKYDTSYENLYRHLNGSLNIIEDILTNNLSGIKAKQILLEKEGIKK